MYMYVSMFLLSDIFGMIIIQYENLGALPRVLCWAYGSRHDERDVEQKQRAWKLVPYKFSRPRCFRRLRQGMILDFAHLEIYMTHTLMGHDHT